jgi:integrase
MASLRKRATRAGSVRWQVRWRQGEAEVSESFPTEAGAIKFRGLVDAAGQRYPEGWAPGRGFIQVESEGGPTLAQWFQRAVDSRPGANNRTRSDYRRDFVTHVPEWLACKPIETISREDVGKWLTELQKSLAPKTIHNIHGMVSSVMKDAQTDGLLTRNPFLGRSKSVVIRHEEMVFLSPQEFSRFLEFVTEFYRPFLRFLFGTGLRWSEATALRAEHIDLPGSRLFVVTAWKRQPGGAPLSMDPKSARSRRTVTLTPRLVELLRPLVQGRFSGELVWVNKAGNRIQPGTFYNDVWDVARKKAEAAGFAKHPRIHDLRHSHASVLLSGGQPVLAVSRRLGHASSQITSDRYGHLLPEVDVALLNLMGEAGL